MSDVPDYGNTGGTGDRQAIITVSTDLTYINQLVYLVDGSFGNSFYFKNQSCVDKFLKFDFGVGAVKIITEAKWYQSGGTQSGTWKWQGSNDDANWSDIGGAFYLSAFQAIQTQTSLAGNALGYRYYRLLGVSGTASAAPYVQEIEFKIADASASAITLPLFLIAL